jgi:hypothetical protein
VSPPRPRHGWPAPPRRAGGLAGGAAAGGRRCGTPGASTRLRALRRLAPATRRADCAPRTARRRATCPAPLTVAPRAPPPARQAPPPPPARAARPEPPRTLQELARLLVLQNLQLTEAAGKSGGDSNFLKPLMSPAYQVLRADGIRETPVREAGGLGWAARGMQRAACAAGGVGSGVPAPCPEPRPGGQASPRVHPPGLLPHAVRPARQPHLNPIRPPPPAHLTTPRPRAARPPSPRPTSPHTTSSTSPRPRPRPTSSSCATRSSWTSPSTATRLSPRSGRASRCLRAAPTRASPAAPSGG